MCKKSKLFAALAIALIVCLSCVTTAFAATSDPAKGATGKPDSPADAAITKILQMPKGTDVPKADFEFIVKSVTVDGEKADGSNMPLIGVGKDTSGIVKISFNGGEAIYKTQGDVDTYYIEESLFANTKWPHAGVYVYEVTEKADTFTAKDKHETMDYSDASYTLNVYVKEENGKCYIFAIGAYATTKDENGPDVNEKIIVTPGGEDKYDFSQMIFTNTYVKTNGPDIPETPKPGEYTLAVSKTVTGGFGDRTMYFSFSMTVTKPSLVPDKPDQIYRAYVVENDQYLTAAQLAANGLTSTDTDGNGHAYVKFESGVPKDFKLKDGQRLEFINTQVGASYEVTETKPNDYMQSVKITYNGQTPQEMKGEANKNLSTGNQFVGEATNLAAYTNEHNDSPITGLNLNDLPFIGMIALAIGAIAAYAVVKARKARRTAASYR